MPNGIITIAICNGIHWIDRHLLNSNNTWPEINLRREVAELKNQIQMNSSFMQEELNEYCLFPRSIYVPEESNILPAVILFFLFLGTCSGQV